MRGLEAVETVDTIGSNYETPLVHFIADEELLEAQRNVASARREALRRAVGEEDNDRRISGERIVQELVRSGVLKLDVEATRVLQRIGVVPGELGFGYINMLNGSEYGPDEEVALQLVDADAAATRLPAGRYDNFGSPTGQIKPWQRDALPLVEVVCAGDEANLELGSVRRRLAGIAVVPGTTKSVRVYGFPNARFVTDEPESRLYQPKTTELRRNMPTSGYKESTTDYVLEVFRTSEPENIWIVAKRRMIE
jgi:hypothetical protein